MSQISNIQDIAFSTAFDVDKLFDDRFSGSFSVGASAFPGSAGNVVTRSIANPRGVSVLPIMQFSTDNSTWYDAGAMRFVSSSSLANSRTLTATCYTTSANIVIVAQNWTGSAITCYYRVLLISET